MDNFPMPMTETAFGEPRVPPMSERLQNEKERLEQRLFKVNKALDLLNSDLKLRDALDAITELEHVY